jgi:hypothetical protein
MDTVVAFTLEYSKGIESKGTCVYYLHIVGPRTPSPCLGREMMGCLVLGGTSWKGFRFRHRTLLAVTVGSRQMHGFLHLYSNMGGSIRVQRLSLLRPTPRQTMGYRAIEG